MNRRKYIFRLSILAAIGLVVGFITTFNVCAWIGGANHGYCSKVTGGLVYYLPSLILMCGIVFVALYENFGGKKLIQISLVAALPLSFLFSFLGYHQHMCCQATDNPHYGYTQGFPFITSSGSKGDSYGDSATYNIESYVANYLFFLIATYFVLGISRGMIQRQPEPASSQDLQSTKPIYASNVYANAPPVKKKLIKLPQKKVIIQLIICIIIFYIIWIIVGSHEA